MRATNAPPTSIGGVSTLTGTVNHHGDDWEASTATKKIFGRVKETKVLLDAYYDVVANRKAVAVLTHGAAGSGKTSLVDLLREPVCESQGYFSAGKFFQETSETRVPYSAIVTALSDLCDLITQSSDFESRRLVIRKAMGAELLLLAKFTSSISPFLDEEELDLDTDFKNENALARIKIAFKTFLQALSSQDHPIVIFFDDIQWMDAGSKEVIELFLADGDLEHVFIVLAYRDEEVQRVTELLHENIRSRCIDLGLNDLDSDGVHELVVGVLQCVCLTSRSKSLVNSLLREQTETLSTLFSSSTQSNAKDS